MTKDRFLALSNSALKMASGKNYSEVGIILEVNNELLSKHEWRKDISLIN